MRYAKSGNFSSHEIGEVIKALQTAPANHSVYIRHVDAVYPVTGISVDLIEDGTVSFSSEETYADELSSWDNGDKSASWYTVVRLLDELSHMIKEKQFDVHAEVCLEAAANVDTSLDMQLEEPCEIKGWGINNVLRDFYLIAGGSWDYV